MISIAHFDSQILSRLIIPHAMGQYGWERISSATSLFAMISTCIGEEETTHHAAMHCSNPKETPSSEPSWSSTFNWHYIAFEFGVTVANHGRRQEFIIAGGASGLFGNFIACDHGGSIGVDPDAPLEKGRRFHHLLESSQSRSRGSLSAFDGRASGTL